METITQEKLQQLADDQKPEVKQEQPKMRQIIIETNGQQIKVVKNECSGLETLSILSILLQKIQKN